MAATIGPKLSDSAQIQTMQAAGAPQQSPAPRQNAAQPLSPFGAGKAVSQTGAQRAYDNDGFSLAQAMTTLGKVSQDALRNSGNLARAASQNEIAAKKQGVADQKSQIKGEQTAEAVKMAGAGLSAGAAGGMSFKGAQMSMAVPKASAGDNAEAAAKRANNRKAFGSGLDAMGKAIAQPTGQVFDTVDKFAGGTAQADRAKVALKQDEVQAEVAKSNSEAAKQGVQQSQEAVKNVNSVTLEHLQRWAGVYSRI